MNILSLVSKMISSPQHQVTVLGLAMFLTMMMMTMRKFLQRHLALVSNVLVQHSNPQHRGTVLGLAIFFQRMTVKILTQRRLKLAPVPEILSQHPNQRQLVTAVVLAIRCQQIRVKLLPQRLPALKIQSQESQMISDLQYRVTALGLVMFFKTRTKNGKHRTWNADVIDEWVGALIKEQTKRAWTYIDCI
ncbi:hypothetical protein NC651_013495 [Populus alba x Populus x berolinensis]|nr:hypothetical protein NC651_013495 [Populus alba x Populus x berolinensis]